MACIRFTGYRAWTSQEDEASKTRNKTIEKKIIQQSHDTIL